ncbi:MAG: hypothetical protein QOE09_1126 [Ilumatobacteraceae bacterium]
MVRVVAMPPVELGFMVNVNAAIVPIAATAKPNHVVARRCPWSPTIATTSPAINNRSAVPVEPTFSTTLRTASAVATPGQR